VRLLLLLLGLQLAGIVAFLLLEDALLRSVVLAASPFQTTVAVVVATRLHRPDRARAWYLLGLGVAGSGTGWAIWYLTPWGDGIAGDVAFLTGYVVSAVALLWLSGLGSRRQQVAALDAALLTVGLGVLSWALVVSPATRAPGVTLTEQLISTAYPCSAR
jgi:hypothetical protein